MARRNPATAARPEKPKDVRAVRRNIARAEIGNVGARNPLRQTALPRRAGTRLGRNALNRAQTTRIERAGLATPLARRGGRLVRSNAANRKAGARGD